MTTRTTETTSRDDRSRMGLAELVLSAAHVAPGRTALFGADHPVSFADLARRTREIGRAMNGSADADDSALVIALMMAVPHLAGSGAGSLESVLTPLRSAATSALTRFDADAGRGLARATTGR